MRSHGWIFLGIALALTSAPFGAFAQKIGGDTTCADISAVINAPQPDKQQVQAIAEQVRALLFTLDNISGTAGEPAVIAPMSEQGRNNAVDSVMAGCLEHSHETLRESAVQVYEHLKDVRKAMGVDPGK